MNRPLTEKEADIVRRTPEFIWPDDLREEAETIHHARIRNAAGYSPDDVLSRSPWPGTPVRRSIFAGRFFELLGDALGAVSLFVLLWIALAVLT